MRYLVDVNVLLALIYRNHADHGRANRWLASLPKGDRLVTCSITELGCVRVGVASRLAPTIAFAQKALAEFKRAAVIEFVADDVGADRFPAFVNTAAETTDGHLLELATAHGFQFATFDRSIPGAQRIP